MPTAQRAGAWIQAEATATNNVLERTQTPAQALQYIDGQANAG
ncbi:MAG: hypothetical protein M0Z33_09810 [Actinomycetota bacterium]|nr:hypothetical protein [Actinomycetota bacterium]